MKKAIFAILTVMLALLVVTCDLAEEAPAAEEGWVTIGIAPPSDNARALIDTAAETAANFYEVVFYRESDGALVRYSGLESAVFTGTPAAWRVRVPIAVYNNLANKAVMFAGDDTTKTLLGIGTITGNATVSLGTSSISFAMKPVECLVDDSTSSSFLITTNTAKTSTQNVTAGTAAGGSYTGPVTLIESGDVFGAKYEFTVPNNSLMVIGPTTSAVTSADAASTGVVIGTAPANVNVDNGTGVTVGIESSPVTASTSSTVTIYFGINTESVAEGLSKLSIKIPVFAYSTDAGDTYGTAAATGWFLRGGLDETVLDTGTGAGGAVLLYVADSTTIGITKTW